MQMIHPFLSYEGLQSEYPNVSIQVIPCTTMAPNAKVGSLIDLLQAARHPICVVNDSDITVPSNYLDKVVAPLENPAVGLVTCLYRAGADSFASKWEALGIATDFAPSALVAPLVGVNEFGLGSTLAFGRLTSRRLADSRSSQTTSPTIINWASRSADSGRELVLTRMPVETHLGTGHLEGRVGSPGSLGPHDSSFAWRLLGIAGNERVAVGAACRGVRLVAVGGSLLALRLSWVSSPAWRFFTTRSLRDSGGWFRFGICGDSRFGWPEHYRGRGHGAEKDYASIAKDESSATIKSAMPIYEYKCEACGGNYEQIRRMAEADRDLECPTCKSHEVNRSLSSFATTSGAPDRAPMTGGGCGMDACAGWPLRVRQQLGFSVVR